jgi:thioredoxin-related protein
MRLIREQFLFLLLLLGLMLPSASAIANEYDQELPAVTVVKAKDLVSDARLSRNQHKPILLFFSMQGCSWCEYVEEEHLKPMLRNADYRKKVIIRKVMTDDYSSVIDFNGTPISVSQLSLRYNASFTPTVIFLDHNGQQLAPRILGVRNTEMYGGDLDEGIELSCQRLRQQNMALSQ